MHITISKHNVIASVIVTNDIPGQPYLDSADQVVRGSRGGLRIWTVIRGGVLPMDKIQELWRAYTDDPRKWLNVNLENLSMDPWTFSSFRERNGRRPRP